MVVMVAVVVVVMVMVEVLAGVALLLACKWGFNSGSACRSSYNQHAVQIVLSTM